MLPRIFVPRTTSLSSTFSKHSRPSSAAIISRMASSNAAPKRHEWMIIIPDHPGVLEKRMEVRPSHLAALKQRQDSGFWKLGGGTLDEEIKENQGPKINGSVMLAFAESREEVEQVLREDIYHKSGVWNLEKAQILPFRSAFLLPYPESGTR